MANLILLSPAGYRNPEDIHRIIREKSRIQGSMGNIVEWQSLKMQEYRYSLMLAVARFFGLFGVFKPLSLDELPTPPKAGDYEDVLNHSEQQTFLDQYLESQPKPEPRLGGAPKEVRPDDDNE
jgi:hypothetical protein